MQHPKEHLKTIQLRLNKLKTKIAIESRAFFDDSFRKQGFEDINLQRWQARKPTKRQRFRNPARGILILTGDLRRSLKAKISNNNIYLESIVPYAKIHNEGKTMKNGQKMPKRQFIGKSEKLNKKITQLIQQELNKL